MRVLYDHQAFTKQRYGGISRCFMELYQHLPIDIEAEMSVAESNNVYLKNIYGLMPDDYQYSHFICKHDFPMKRRLHIIYDKITNGGYYPDYNQTCSKKKIQEGNFDIFHPTYFEDYFLPYLNGKPFVLTIHDMIPELYPRFFDSNNWQIKMKQKLAPLASAIIAVSENTKKDIIRYLNVPEEKVHVIYHGCSFPSASETFCSIKDYAPYILYVGGREFYKNFVLFVKHIRSFLLSHPEISVLCTGEAFNESEIQLLTSYGVRDRFIHYWCTTDEELYTLYHNALCFVFPSEYEGFGIPILEAYKADCPVLLNFASCFPEIAGDAAIYFEMDSNSSDIVDKLEHIYLMDAGEKETLLAKQHDRLKQYSWEKSAQQLKNVYKLILQT